MAAMIDRPTPEMVDKGWDRNKHGGGIAWREKDEATGKVMVHWAKGLTLEQMKEACATLPIPFIAHLRVASSGGIRPDLCHPFEISLTTPNTTDGVTENPVLFHNGDWSSWREVMLKGALRMGLRIPDGKWSDSRAMAWLSAMFGPNIMDVIDQKGVMFGPGTGNAEDPWDGIEFFLGSGWSEINKVWCSNDLFWGGVRASVCSEQTCHERSGLDSFGRCSKHRKTFPIDPTILPNDDDEVPDAEVCHALVRMHDYKDRVKGKKNTGSGGNQTRNPFPVEIQALIDAGYKDQAMNTAERMHERDPKKLSKNALKRIRVALTGSPVTPILKDDGLKDPRVETVTVH